MRRPTIFKTLDQQCLPLPVIGQFSGESGQGLLAEERTVAEQDFIFFPELKDTDTDFGGNLTTIQK